MARILRLRQFSSFCMKGTFLGMLTIRLEKYMTANSYPHFSTTDLVSLLGTRKTPLTEDTALLVLDWLEEGKSELAITVELRQAYPELYQVHTAGMMGNPSNHLTSKIQACTALLLGTCHHERVMAVAIKGEVRIDLFALANKQDYGQSLVRKCDGQLYANSELKRLLRERLSIDALLLSVAKHNDLEAYRQLIKIKPVSERACIQSIMQFARNHRVSVPNSFLSSIGGANKPIDASAVDVNDYVGAFKGSGPESLASMLADYYQPALTPLVGHELFHALFIKNSYWDSPENREYVGALMRDGADWYIGLQQSQVGSHVYLGLLTRTKDPVAELEALVKHGLRTSNQALVGEILKHVPLKVIMAYADTEPKANQVYRIVRLECIKDRVSKKLHEKNFGADLGL